MELTSNNLLSPPTAPTLDQPLTEEQKRLNELRKSCLRLSDEEGDFQNDGGTKKTKYHQFIRTIQKIVVYETRCDRRGHVGKRETTWQQKSHHVVNIFFHLQDEILRRRIESERDEIPSVENRSDRTARTPDHLRSNRIFRQRIEVRPRGKLSHVVW